MNQPPPITSLVNPRVKAAVRLRDRRERAATGLTLVDGGRELLRGIEAGVAVEEAFVCEDVVRSLDASRAIVLLRELGVLCLSTSPAVFAKVAFGQRSEGVVAVVRAPATDLGLLRLPADPLVIVAEGVEKPGNLGAILRSADGAGADALIAASPRTDLFNPNAIRASLGTIFAVRLAAAPSDVVLGWLREQGLRIVAARMDADRLATESDLGGPLAIVVGTEAEGLSDVWSADDVRGVRLPMFGVADSLNVAAAGAVLLYEARRQRGEPGGHRDLAPGSVPRSALPRQ